MVQELIHPDYGPLRLLGIPIKLSETPGALETAPPRFGQHNGTILASLGYEPDAVRAMAGAGVISAS
jgi:formyl-CoA transferase/CoA:oxalate CoA-transferase